MTSKRKVAKEGKPERLLVSNPACPVFMSGAERAAPFRLRGFMVFLSTSHTSQRNAVSVSAQPAGVRWRATAASLCRLPLPAPTHPGERGFSRSGACRKALSGWPLPMAPAESFEVVRKQTTKSRNKETQVSRLLRASWDCPEPNKGAGPSPAAAFSTKCSSCQKLARSGYFSFTVKAIKCSSVIFLSVDLVSSS